MRVGGMRWEVTLGRLGDSEDQFGAKIAGANH